MRHVGITVNARQPLIHEQTWSSLPTQRSVHTSRAVWPKDEAHNSSFLPQFNSGVHSPVLFRHLEEEIGIHLSFSSAMDTDSKEGWLSGSTKKVSQVSPTFTPISENSARPRATCGQQESQSDGQARKSP